MNKNLTHVLDRIDFQQVIIFVRNSRRAIKLKKWLVKQGYLTIDFHSGLEQEERFNRYRSFKKSKNHILVTTDMFCRGIDIESVNLVVNYDMPTTTNTLLHRVARSGQFGTKGKAVSFVSSTADSLVLHEFQSRFKVTFLTSL